MSLALILGLPACEEVGPDAGCFESYADEEFGFTRIENTCEYESPCDPLMLLCPGSDEAVDCGPNTAIVENPEALSCMLDGLAERRTGRFAMSATAQNEPGWASRGYRLWSIGSKGYYAGSYQVDLSAEEDGVRFVRLRSRTDFERCRDADTDAERLDCVMDPFEEVLGVVIPR